MQSISVIAKHFKSSTARRFKSSNIHNNFYKVNIVDYPNRPDMIVGEVIDHAVDLKKTRPGDVIEVPYELTVNSGLVSFWQSCFHSNDRINTSTPFARRIKLQDQVVPFGLMLFLASSMSHADHAKVQLGFQKARYHWPLFVGDTIKKKFMIKSLKNTSDGKHSIFKVYCEVRNQRNVLMFTCEKTMLFPFNVFASDIEVDSSFATHRDDFLRHLISQTDTLQESGSQTLSSLRPGQLIIHTLMKPLSLSVSMQLACLGRLTHERHYNTHAFHRDELLVPGGAVLALTCAMASRDLHEVLYEELLECTFPAPCSPDDTVSSMTYVVSREEHVGGDVEAVTVRTVGGGISDLSLLSVEISKIEATICALCLKKPNIERQIINFRFLCFTNKKGVKNAELQKVLPSLPLPMELFLQSLPLLRPAALEELVQHKCPELSKKIVCIADRKIYRLTPKQTPFLL